MSTQSTLPLPMPNAITRSAFVDQSGILTPDTQKWVRQLPGVLANRVASQFSDTHAARLKVQASQVAQGVLWRETDRGLLYVAEGTAWQYVAGIFSTTSDVLPTDLGASDSGLLVYVSDFNDRIRWNGTGWEWEPGYLHDAIVVFLNTPTDPGWQICDGTAGVSRFNSDGSIDSVTVPTIAAIAGTAGYFYKL